MTVRPVIEIQRAHDMIVAIMLKEVPNPGFDEKYLHCAAAPPPAEATALPTEAA